jgi:alpha/beta hydrolase family protein
VLVGESRGRYALVEIGGFFMMCKTLSPAFCAAVLVFSLVGITHAVVPAAVPNAVTLNGAPFDATDLNLARFGYVEKEFYLSGSANRYRIANPLGTAEVIDGGYPYVTRILVRRPKHPEHFNGIVVVEWYNVTAGQDVDFQFAAMHEHLLREGYAWVGVSAQLIGINALRTANPERYGSLTAAASNVDPVGGGQIDSTGDVLSWDIYSQTGTALSTYASIVLGNLKPKMLLALGESQSAFRLTQYYNSIQPLHHIYEGFLTYDRTGPLRTDTGVKSISIGTEALGTLIGAPPNDFADARWYEVAGASHISLHDANYIDPIIKQDGLFRDANGQPLTFTEQLLTQGCVKTPLFSRVPSGHVLDAALEHLVRWVKTGEAPPTAERFERTATGQLLRDAEGRVHGGVRLAAYDAPRAANAGGDNPPTVFCALSGYHFDYSDEKLCDIYGSHRGYAQRVWEVTERAQRAGFVVQADAFETVLAAARFHFPSCEDDSAQR